MLWTEKHRPRLISEIIGNTNIKIILANFVLQNELPHLLLYGPSGIGKTTIIRALINEITQKPHDSKYTPHLGNVLEINASDDRSIKVVRDVISGFISTSLNICADSESDASRAVSLASLKIVILEEVDSFTADAQFCLRRLVELHAGHARFCMTCNNVNRLIPALRSRCCEYKLQKLSETDIKHQLNLISEKEHFQITEEALKVISEYSAGDLRRAVSAMQVVFSTLEHALDESQVEVSVINQDHVLQTLGYLASGALKQLLSEIKDIRALSQVIVHVSEFINFHQLDPKHFVERLWSVMLQQSENEDLGKVCISLADISSHCSKYSSRVSIISAIGAVLFFHYQSTSEPSWSKR